MKNLNRKVVIYLSLALGLSTFFWVYSRYPGLLKKAAKGTTQETQAWAFDLLWKDSANQGIAENIAMNFINWCYTNWKGMTFGILLAAILVSLFENFKGVRFKNPWLRTLFGAGIGASLGLCANCAAPVGLGMKKGGASTETALATMMTSPTLNFVCVTMAFSLLPFAFASLKIISTFLVLVLIPAVVSYASNKEEFKKEIPDVMTAIIPNESWLQSFKSVWPILFKNLFFVFKASVPLMLLAGLLGSIIFEVLPIGWLTSIEPTIGNIFLVALVGTLIPAPMTFDVIFSAKLLQAGASPAIAMTMLFSLGIFSVYSMMVIGKYFSAKLATALFFLVWLISLLSAAVIGFA